MITAGCERIKAAIEEMPAAQLLAAMLTFAGIDPADFFAALFERVIALSVNAPRLFAHRLRQPFLKLDAVFFCTLVYSGCSASRFPSARSD
jgi:hypothetical protein